MKYSTDACVMIDARYLTGATSGIGRYTENLVEELLELDDALRIRLITSPKRPDPVKHERVECRTFGGEPNSLRTRFLLGRMADFDGVDLYHSPFNILPAGVPVPSVFTLHDIMWLLDVNYCTDALWRKIVTGTFYKQLIPRSARQATRIMTVSEHSKQAIEDYFPETAGRVHVTYNGVDPFFHPVELPYAAPLLKRYIDPAKPFVLVVGQGSPYKNHAGALAGFIEAFRHDPDMQFVLIRRLTRGPAKELHRLMEDPDVAGRIVHLEHVSGEELRAFYTMAQAFLFPSLYEGFGLPALEAMACGTPVVTSNYGAPAEVGGEAAIKVDPKDPAAIGAALRRLHDEPDYYAERREASLAHAATFTWRRCAEQALDVYRQILGAPS